MLNFYSPYTRAMIKAFVNQYGETIIDKITNTGIFFPMVVAQLSAEGGVKLQSDGTLTASTLATRYNNWGGIKDFSGNGVNMDTTEKIGGSIRAVKQPFMQFADFGAFMNRYVDLLLNGNGGKYRPALKANSPEQQVKLLVAAGYSTLSPNEYYKTVKDRINACMDEFPFLSRIESVVPAGNPGEEIRNLIGSALTAGIGI